MGAFDWQSEKTPQIGDWPPVKYVDSRHYGWWIKPPKALRERGWALNQRYSPRGNTVWDSGTVSSIGKTTMTDTTKNWVMPSSGGGCTYSGKRWFDFNVFGNPDDCPTYLPRFYDLVIDAGPDKEPWQVVRTRITNNSLMTLDFEEPDWVTFRQIDDMQDLVGKPYFIIKRDGLFPTERWPDWPAAWSYYRGVVEYAENDFVSIKDGSWPPGHWTRSHPEWPLQPSSYDLMIRIANKWRRLRITANTAASIHFQAQEAAATKGTPFWIIKSDEMWHPDHDRGGHIRKWYGGAAREIWSHSAVFAQIGGQGANTWLDLSRQAAQTIKLLFPNPTTGECTDVEHRAAFDVDFWTAIEDQCNPPDHCYSPHLFKTIRGYQLWMQSLAPSFVEMRDWHGKKDIPNLTVAMWHRSANINHFTVTVSSRATDHITFPADGVPTGQRVFYTIHDDYKIIYSGFFEHTTAGRIDGAFLPEVVGKELVLSLGHRRTWERAFRYMFDKWCFIPDWEIKTDDIGAQTLVIHDPPNEDPLPIDEDPTQEPQNNVGFWNHRAKSTTYAEPNFEGFIREGVTEFVVGEYARYRGDNLDDPSTDEERTQPETSRPQGMSPTTRYEDNFATVTRTAEEVVTMRGTATGGGDFWLEDTNVNWWDGVMKEHTGVTDGGGQNFAEDSTKIDSYFWKQPERGRWIGFIFEVMSGNFQGLRLPITGHQGPNFARLTFDRAPSGFDGDGIQYRIREPRYELNKWKGRQVLIVRRNGEQVYIWITHSDDTRLYFERQNYTFEAGDSYYILEPQPGTVWRCDQITLPNGQQGKGWTKPLGPDKKRLGVTVPADFHDRQTENLPTLIRGYGLASKLDVWDMEVLKEIYRGINALRWTKMDYAWVDDPNNPTAPNSRGASNTLAAYPGDPSYLPTSSITNFWNTLINGWPGPPIAYTGFLTHWNDPANLGHNLFGAFTVPQGTGYYSSYHQDHAQQPNQDMEVYIDAQASFKYGKLTGVPALMSHATDWYVYATIDQIDSEETKSGNINDVFEGEEYNRFNNHGTGLIWRRYAKWHSSPPHKGAELMTSSQLGDTTSFTMFNPASLSISTDALSYGTHGWYAYRKTAILKWDVNGGMKFIADLTSGSPGASSSP